MPLNFNQDLVGTVAILPSSLLGLLTGVGSTWTQPHTHVDTNFFQNLTLAPVFLREHHGLPQVPGTQP